MKVIDLIMKQYYGDKMPKTIIINNCQYEYDDEKRTYIDYHGYTMIVDFKDDVLNMEVEIIEEDKPIEKLEIIENEIDKQVFLKVGEHLNTMRKMDVAFAQKINELVKEINKLKEN